MERFLFPKQRALGVYEEVKKEYDKIKEKEEILNVIEKQVEIKRKRAKIDLQIRWTMITESIENVELMKIQLKF